MTEEPTGSGRLRILALPLIAVVAAFAIVAAFRFADIREAMAADPPVDRIPEVEFEPGDWSALLDMPQTQFRVAAADFSTRHGKSAAVPLLEVARLRREQFGGPATLAAAEAAGMPRDSSNDEIFRAVWAGPYEPIPDYAGQKSRLYSRIDRRFAEYFADLGDPAIRLDEIRWGGVRRDGIPPLKDPETASAGDEAAGYLGEKDVVFGVAWDGEAVAYPKRILAWHEMVKDSLAGVEFCGVYCTLCGSMIVYEADLDGRHHELGTSGFLYRSNKLMYDHATKSLWSTLEGRPVVGPLTRAEPPIELTRRPVVTTTWGEWRRRHPQTRVLTLNTGHQRDYGEGVAYRDYFATDGLMFGVPDVDMRGLNNKQEILGLRFGAADGGEERLAIKSEYLRANRFLRDRVGDQDVLVLTGSDGTSRVYQAGDPPIESYDGDATATDADGETWQMTEDALVSESGRRGRLPSHRAFWFGWVSAYPNTRLLD